jgi:hypothetical protein
MLRIAMSAAASALFRALVARAAVPRDRILLSEWRSVDWQSLTFIGERPEIAIRVTGAEAREAAARLLCGLEEAEFAIPGQIVVDVRPVGEPEFADGSAELRIEALTIAE